MNILQRFLYLFRTLPISIHMPDLKLLQRKISNFIWMNKIPRVNAHTVHAPKLQGGLGLSYLVKYFHATQLAQLTHFLSHLPQPSWMKIESSLYPSKPISHLLWLQNKNSPPIMCPTLFFFFSLWDRLSKAHQCISPHVPLAPLTGNPSFASGLNPLVFLGGRIKVYYELLIFMTIEVF